MRHIFFVGFTLLFLISCSKSSSTAPSDFTISAPESTTETYSNPTNMTAGRINYTLPFVVRDSLGNPRQGIEVEVYALNATLFSDEGFTVPVLSKNEVSTDSFGVAKVYLQVKHPACDAATDITIPVTVTGSLPTTSAQWTDLVTVKKCGT